MPVDLSAAWCPSYRALDSDASPALCARYGIRANPTLIVFDGGQEIRRPVGLLNRQRVIALFADRLGSATASL